MTFGTVLGCLPVPIGIDMVPKYHVYSAIYHFENVADSVQVSGYIGMQLASISSQLLPNLLPAYIRRGTEVRS